MKIKFIAKSLMVFAILFFCSGQAFADRASVTNLRANTGGAKNVVIKCNVTTYYLRGRKIKFKCYLYTRSGRYINVKTLVSRPSRTVTSFTVTFRWSKNYIFNKLNSSRRQLKAYVKVYRYYSGRFLGKSDYVNFLYRYAPPADDDIEENRPQRYRNYRRSSRTPSPSVKLKFYDVDLEATSPSGDPSVKVTGKLTARYLRGTKIKVHCRIYHKFRIVGKVNLFLVPPYRVSVWNKVYFWFPYSYLHDRVEKGVTLRAYATVWKAYGRKLYAKSNNYRFEFAQLPQLPNFQRPRLSPLHSDEKVVMGSQKEEAVLRREEALPFSLAS